MKYIFRLSLFLFIFPVHALAFDFDDVAAKAKQLAAKPYSAPEINLPKALTNLSYDQYRDIRFRPDQTPWRNTGAGFDLAFFHQGSLFNVPVKIHEVVAGTAREIRFDPKLFNYGPSHGEPIIIYDAKSKGAEMYLELAREVIHNG